MLPDFPELKRLVLDHISDLIRDLVDKRHPILPDIKAFQQHEGRALRVEQIGYGEKRQELEVHSIPVEIKFDEVPSLLGQALVAKLEVFVEGTAKAQIEMLIARLDEATEMTGNRLNAGGRPLDGAMLLEFLSGLQTDFDSEGNTLQTNKLLTHPNMMATYRAAVEEIQNDPELKTRYERILGEHYQQWTDRESRRKLAD